MGQAGFRKGLSTAHRMLAVSMLQEKCHECQCNLWLAALDFKKAFDCVGRRCLWRALVRRGVPSGR
eukprot:9479333-Pyramimonas_sp.AAC.1